MKKTKAIFLSLCLVVITVAMSGCMAMGYSFVSNDDGSYAEIYAIALDKDYLEKNDLELEPIKTEIMNDFMDYKSLLNQVYTNNHLIKKGTTPTDIGVTSEQIWEDNVFTGKIIYSSLETLIIIYGENIYQSVRWETDKKPFLNKHYYLRLTDFAYIQSEGSFYNMLYEKYTTEYNDFLDFENVYYLYRYETSDSRLHSDADMIEKISRELYVHSWVIRADEAATKNITFYYYSVKPLMWYVLAVGITVCFGLIYGLFVHIKHRQKSILINRHRLKSKD